MILTFFIVTSVIISIYLILTHNVLISLLSTLLHLPHHTEEVNVGVVDREVNEDNPCPSLDPAVVKQVVNDVRGLRFVQSQVLHVASSTVCCQQTPVTPTI